MKRCLRRSTERAAQARQTSDLVRLRLDQRAFDGCDRMKLFCLDSRNTQAEALARRLGVGLSAHEERKFEDTEFKIRPLESVRGEHVFVYSSLHADAEASSSDKLCRLLFFCGALRDAAAERVTAVTPYLAYSRKDRRTKTRDPVTTRYVAQMFEALGTHSIVTADVHNVAAYENAFRCEKLNVEAAPVIADHFAATLKTADPIVALSPDAGGVKRARRFADLLSQKLGMDVALAFMEKYRSEGQVTGELFAGRVKDAIVVVIDDLISGGTTMARAARACMEQGAIGVHAAATHGLFAEGADDKLTALDSVVVTDTIGDAAARCPALGARLVLLDSSVMFAPVVERLSRRSC
jgi:ribose-phosphate pyrophosphokinase